jgi:alpha-tubulin suppressor-like RCC1 family protein
VAVSGLSGVTEIAAGYYHTCALLSGGEVRCWGSGGFGQLGDGSATLRLTPVGVSGLGGVTAIAAGGEHTCAMLSGGEVRCWGYNGRGQLGDGTATFRPFPAPVLIDVGLFSNGFEAP